MAKQQKQSRRDESGNPLKPGGDDTGHAPESGEPTEMGFSHGKPIEKADERRRDKSGDAKDVKSARRGK
jgi:hypothetical protein